MFICDITMSGLLEVLTSFASFFFTILSDAANWFVSNLIGQIILGVAIISVVIEIFLTVKRNMR